MKFLILIFVLVAFWMGYQWFKREKIKRTLNLSLSLDSEEVNIGDTLYFTLHSKPKVTVKALQIEGDLICHRYSSSSLRWIDELGFLGISGGQILKMLIFSFGKDLVFLENTDSSFRGYVPIPQDSEPTLKDGSLEVRWTLTVRVHIEGFKPIRMRKEVIVKRGSSVVKPSNKEEKKVSKTFVGFPKRKKVFRGENVTFLIEGEENVSKEEDNDIESRFQYLELEDEGKSGGES